MTPINWGFIGPRMNFLEQNLPHNMAPGEPRRGFQGWLFRDDVPLELANPLCILYLGVMCVSLMLRRAFDQPPDDRRRGRRGRDYDDDDD